MTTTGVNLTGSMLATGNVSAWMLIATGGATVTGGLNVTNLGASITGNSTVTGLLNVSNTLSVSAGGASITGDSTFYGSISSTGNMSSGGTLSVVGATTLKGLSCTGAATFSLGANSLSFTSSNSTMGLNATTTANVGISCQPGGFYSGQNWIRIINGSAGSIVCQSWNSSMTFTAGSSSWTAASDERLTDITGTYTNALEDIGKIKPIKFTWKQHPEDGAQVGVIAQTVQAVVPEAVSTITYQTDQQEYLGVRYTELIPIMIAGLQEATARIEALEAQVANC